MSSNEIRSEFYTFLPIFSLTQSQTSRYSPSIVSLLIPQPLVRQPINEMPCAHQNMNVIILPVAGCILGRFGRGRSTYWTLECNGGSKFEPLHISTQKVCYISLEHVQTAFRIIHVLLFLIHCQQRKHSFRKQLSLQQMFMQSQYVILVSLK